VLAVLWRFRATLVPHRRRLAMGSVLVLAAAALELALPWPLALVVDGVLGGEGVGGVGGPVGRIVERLTGGDTTAVLALAAGTLVVVAALGAVTRYASDRLLEGVGERVLADLRTTTFAHLQRLSLPFHAEHRVGDLSERLTADVATMQGLLVATLSVLVPNVVLLAGIAVVTIAIDPGFALLALAIAPALFGVVLHYRRRIKAAAREARRHEGAIAAHATETLSAIRLVQTHAAEDRSDARFAGHVDARLVAGTRRLDLAARLPAAVEVVAQTGRAVVLVVGAARVLDGSMRLGVLLVFLSYLQQLYAPMKSLAKLSTTISKGQASAERVEEVLRTERAIADRPGAVGAEGLRGELELRDVTFGYDGAQPVLHGVSLRAAPGETVALAGPTGAGKSTVLGLLSRLHDPDAGTVLVDGRDVRDYRVASLRRQVAVVPQDPVLVAGTLLENIAYGAPGASRDQLLAAAEAACVDEFAVRLPAGYDTVVGERGATLSGGQRQRVAIARALVRDCPVVLLDEPTSGLDAVSERLVVQGLERLTKGRTVVVVAHRLSTLQHADRVYVVAGGAVADVGTHDELCARAGTYQDMHDALVGV